MNTTTTAGQVKTTLTAENKLQLVKRLKEVERELRSVANAGKASPELAKERLAIKDALGVKETTRTSLEWRAVWASHVLGGNTKDAARENVKRMKIAHPEKSGLTLFYKLESKEA